MEIENNMKIQTKITKMLNIDLPIIGAPMFLVSYPDLVIAVSEAGGLGTLTSVNYRTTSELNDALQFIRTKTKKPIGINIILYKEKNPNWEEQLKVCLDNKIELIITSLGTPKSIVKEVKSIGSHVFCDVTTARHAKIIAKAGADALIAVAQGAGGHAGAISPFSLIPYLAEETGLPIIAAGAISTGKQMAAALSLGAEAVYVGTRLIATPEAKASQDYKDMILKAKPEEITYSDKISGISANWLNESLKKLDAIEAEKHTDNAEMQAVKRWKDIWSAGHGVAQIKDIKPAGEVIQSMAKEYLDIVQNLPRA